MFDIILFSFLFIRVPFFLDQSSKWNNEMYSVLIIYIRQRWMKKNVCIFIYCFWNHNRTQKAKWKISIMKNGNYCYLHKSQDWIRRTNETADVKNYPFWTFILRTLNWIENWKFYCGCASNLVHGSCALHTIWCMWCIGINKAFLMNGM